MPELPAAVQASQLTSSHSKKKPSPPEQPPAAASCQTGPSHSEGTLKAAGTTPEVMKMIVPLETTATRKVAVQDVFKKSSHHPRTRAKAGAGKGADGSVLGGGDRESVPNSDSGGWRRDAWQARVVGRRLEIVQDPSK